jgi:hypothetical protein
MKVVVNIPNTLYEEKICDEFLECLEFYMRYLIDYGKQLGICYGLNDIRKFPISGEFKNECINGYVEIIK